MSNQSDKEEIRKLEERIESVSQVNALLDMLLLLSSYLTIVSHCFNHFLSVTLRVVLEMGTVGIN